MITSASNDKIKEIKKLIKSASRRKETGLYIVEGIRMVREIPADAVKTLYVAESMTDKFADICNQIPAEVEIVRDSVFQSMSAGEEAQFAVRLVVRDRTAHHHLVEIAGFQPEIPGRLRGGHQVAFIFHIRSFFDGSLIVPCSLGKPENAVCQPFPFFCFRCKVKFDLKWPNVGQMGKVHEKENAPYRCV